MSIATPMHDLKAPGNRHSQVTSPFVGEKNAAATQSSRKIRGFRARGRLFFRACFRVRPILAGDAWIVSTAWHI
jgi:hypothetical protein